ncbi:hypothetical protein LAZ67_20001491 [Cordylochernes scorpioides]|uniref:Tc1-like transposase DDE domain-containing protein n=1 Tax=Cordylochernes scorpioides TaxID=51811 RepID=A0ABY6LLS0_9ARAC|nr:hypothetical protein LAZ67_20001491 [Cordylochernes scorpioides]
MALIRKQALSHPVEKMKDSGVDISDLYGEIFFSVENSDPPKAKSGDAARVQDHKSEVNLGLRAELLILGTTRFTSQSRERAGQVSNGLPLLDAQLLELAMTADAFSFFRRKTICFYAIVSLFWDYNGSWESLIFSEGTMLSALSVIAVSLGGGFATTVAASTDHSISTRIISRRLVANGLHSCRPLKRLPLTSPNRHQCLEWCRPRSTWMTEWHRVVFSDESRFCLSSDSRRVRVWRRHGERSNPAAIVERPTVRQRGIMVWGAIAYDSRSPLLRIQGTMTAQRYVDDVLRPVTLPYLQGVPNALYQQDNARPHTARISHQALQDVQMLPWPPYSPELSPIEHVWDIIGRRLHALPQPRSEDELWQMLETTERFSKIKPPTYDGQTSWKCFKTQFEVVALGNRWNSSEKAINLAASLRGSATEVLQSLPLEQSLDYERLIHALTLRFGDDILQPYHVVKLKNRRQKRDETL